jgi:hypothetical protein
MCVPIWHNKNVDIKFSAHDAFLESPSSGTLKIERLESQIIWSFGSNKIKVTISNHFTAYHSLVNICSLSSCFTRSRNLKWHSWTLDLILIYFPPKIIIHLGHINFLIVAHVTLDTVKHQHSKTMGHSFVHAKYLNLHSTMMMCY